MAEDTIIITGGNGFVGKHLVQELLLNRGQFRLVVWDKNTEGLSTKVSGLTVDIADPKTYINSVQVEQPAWIIHLAAVASVGASIEEPQKTKEINTLAAHSLFKNVLRVSPKTKFLVASSADIYGLNSEKPIAELSLPECQPKNPYAESKFEMEKMIEEKYTANTIRVRPFPHIGPGQQRGFVTADFASQVVAIEKGEQEPVLRVGNLDAKRDFTDVRDVVKAYRLLLDKGAMGEVYNIASGKAVQITTILDMLLEKSSATISISRDEARMRPSDNPIIVGDSTKLREATGWQPKIPLEQSLTDILTYWRSR